MLTCLTSPLADNLDLVAVQTNFWFGPYLADYSSVYALELAQSQEAHVVSVSEIFNKV